MAVAKGIIASTKPQQPEDKVSPTQKAQRVRPLLIKAFILPDESNLEYQIPPSYK